MPVTLLITFEAFLNLRYLSVITWAVYITGLWYVAYCVYMLNKKLVNYIQEE